MLVVYRSRLIRDRGTRSRIRQLLYTTMLYGAPRAPRAALPPGRRGPPRAPPGAARAPYLSLSLSIYIYIYICISMYISIPYLFTYMYIYIYIYIYTHIYVYNTYMCIYTCVCIHIYIYIYYVIHACFFVCGEQRTHRGVSVPWPNSLYISPSALGPVAYFRTL